jgi:hypothetical protein
MKVCVLFVALTSRGQQKIRHSDFPRSLSFAGAHSSHRVGWQTHEDLQMPVYEAEDAEVKEVG